ncbi:MAG: serine/threonine protein kinase [Bdellovibrionaceae bacterium]|nr:serine/threonine protein kinase [Bdellovibrio sp.]
MSYNYEQFGKYLLLEKIAAGGMAEVYLAKSAAANGLNKFFAIKRILPQYSTNEDFVNMFKEEANVAINLNHSNVVSIFDFGIEKSQFFLVMDYVEGRNLRQIINELKRTNKSFSIDQALFMVKEVAAGLDHAHRCTDSKSGRPLNITHRDMSPQNIMVSFEGEVKVIDFGIAKAETEQEETKAGTLKGKFSYMSPEQAEGLLIDPRTDVFALGIVLWELLANDRLFTGSNEAAILRKVRDCQIPSIRKVNPTIPPELERIVMKSLAKDRNVRYQTAANFHRDLNRFLNTQFPDFSTHDFSQFIKDSFKTAVNEGREKLVHFSKAEILTLDETKTAAPQGLVNKSKDLGSLPPTPFNMQPNSPPPVEPAAKINLEGLLNAKVTDNFKQKLGSTRPPQPNLNKTSVTMFQTHSTQSKKSSSSSFEEYFELGLKSLIVMALLYGGYWGYRNFYGTQVSPEMARAQKIAPKDLKGQFEMAATAAVKVSVNSAPNGAKIFKDSVDTGYTTPAIVTVTANQEVQFVFRKDGYLEYSTSQKFSETGQLAATLQPVAQAAYLNISVSNGGPNTNVFVNGKQLTEKMPVTRYPILASAPAVITAYNPITKLSDEVRITAKIGETKNVELILGRSQGNVKK